MLHKNFRTNIFIRVAVIILLAILLAYLLSNKPSLFSPIVIGGALILSTVNLILYIEKSTRDLTHFLLSIRQNAFTEGFGPSNRGSRFDELGHAFNDVIKEFAKLNLEKELHFQFLQALNENIGIGIITYDAAQKIIHINPAAKKILSIQAPATMHDVARKDSGLAEKMLSLKPEQKLVTRFEDGAKRYQLGIQKKEIVLQGQHMSIVLIQNLNTELDNKELEAWQQLIRVLTHELMNSVTPMPSLSAAMKAILTSDNKQKRACDLTEENVDDLYSSVETINSRAEGLLRFISAYKNLAKPLQLYPQTVDLVHLVSRVTELMRPEAERRHITLVLQSIHQSLSREVDQSLIEQVMINLIKNAIESIAPSDNGQITITLHRRENDQVQITVQDNGAGMDKDIADKIFVPFFTTKPNGTGVGLSFSRQVMKLHGGDLLVDTAPGKGSTFSVIC